MCFLTFLLFLLTGVAADDFESTPPAIIWGANFSKPPTIFETLTSRTFAELILPLLKNNMVIFYFAPELTAKNLSCIEPGCFEYLRRMQPLTYISKVQEPLDALEYLYALRDMNLVWTDTYEMSQLNCEINQLVSYDFADDNVTDHDSFMSAVAETLGDCSVMQIYTAHKEQPEVLQSRIDRINSIVKWEKSVKRARPRVREKPKPVEESNEGKGQKPVVLRDLKCIVAIQKIIFAEQIKEGHRNYYMREEVVPDEKTCTLRLEMPDSSNMKKGVNFTIDTEMGTFQVAIVQMSGNWHITGLYFRNISFLARDQLFYDAKFSFCSSSLTAYSAEGHRLTLVSLSMDLITEDAFSALDDSYVPKPCWKVDGNLTPALAQALFTVLVLLSCFGLGLTMFLEMGRNMRMATIHDPDPYLKEAT